MTKLITPFVILYMRLQMIAKLFILSSPRSTDHLWGSISHISIPILKLREAIFSVSSISDSVLTPSDLLIGLNLC